MPTRRPVPIRRRAAACRVGNHLRRIEAPVAPQPMALLARAIRAVERKRPRLQLRERWRRNSDTPASASTAALRRSPRPPSPGRSPASSPSRSSFQALLDSGLHQQPVHHHFDGVVLALVERDLFVERPQHAVDACAHENPAALSFSSSFLYSPLRPRTIGARTMIRSSVFSASTCCRICSRRLRRDRVPQTGQCGTPIDEYSSRR